LRLHNQCGRRPLVLAEIGLDSLRNGPKKQAGSDEADQLFLVKAAGMFVFTWTDNWWRSGFEIEVGFWSLNSQQKALACYSLLS